ncbi:hypothetical protein GCM10027160_29210 [Streptomyces calidiresistens]|uniref:Uncharacterized protein n=1 Tax=Streptomyces calidiresistens TaxID=1485586 RepID=A0A7W3XW96_9ACTN|nr:hypothetical protein [Streptomyces calidiresistens]MBB0229492.1 hypothetical protein [Streptomyces calidiresistens]
MITALRALLRPRTCHRHMRDLSGRCHHCILPSRPDHHDHLSRRGLR